MTRLIHLFALLGTEPGRQSLFCRALLQKRPIILRSLLIVATPYLGITHTWHDLFIYLQHQWPNLGDKVSFIGLFCKRDLSFQGAYIYLQHQWPNLGDKVSSTYTCDMTHMYMCVWHDPQLMCHILVCVCVCVSDMTHSPIHNSVDRSWEINSRRVTVKRELLELLFRKKICPSLQVRERERAREKEGEQEDEKRETNREKSTHTSTNTYLIQ